MFIDLESVRLRHLARSDGNAIRAALFDGRVARNLANVPFPFPEGAEYVYIERVSKIGGRAIVGRVNGIEILLGSCGVHELITQPSDLDYSCGYWIAPEFWGHGIGTRAIELLITTTPADAIISASVMDDNPVSIHIFEKLGFVKTGPEVCTSKGRGADVSASKFTLMRGNCSK